ncbi:hypothetical protein H2248_000221 [Termitomyces sp. 'cryptogamus']|nr:hypothetical protein H2248_000221 [Termitomyces sp. 'cryptogamus']
MRVLAASKFKNPESENSNVGHRTRKTNRDMGYLETIALYMVSGEDGDVIASASEETKSGINIVLAKNTKASEKDHQDAHHFLNYLENTKVD